MVVVGFPDIGEGVLTATDHVTSIWAERRLNLTAAVDKASGRS